MDKFSQIGTKFNSDEKWDSFVGEIVKKDFIMKLSEFESLLKHSLNMPLSFKEKEALYESYRLK